MTDNQNDMTRRCPWLCGAALNLLQGMLLHVNLLHMNVKNTQAGLIAGLIAHSKANNTAAANMNTQVLLLQSRCICFAVLLPLCFVLAEKCNTAPLTFT